MYWNYRVIKKKNPHEEAYYEVCEVYYDEENRPKSWTENVHLLCFEELDDLKWAYSKIMEAFQKPILEHVSDEKDFLQEVNE